MTTPLPELVHGTCVTIGETGVLLRGRSGAGKSDLALRLIDRGAMLVGDDYLHVTARHGAVGVTVPQMIAGRIEVRGVGIVALPYRASATIGLVIDLSFEPDDEERLPEDRETIVAGIALPLYRLNPFPASAPIKVEILAMRRKDRF